MRSRLLTALLPMTLGIAAMVMTGEVAAGGLRWGKSARPSKVHSQGHSNARKRRTSARTNGKPRVGLLSRLGSPRRRGGKKHSVSSSTVVSSHQGISKGVKDKKTKRQKRSLTSLRTALLIADNESMRLQFGSNPKIGRRLSQLVFFKGKSKVQSQKLSLAVIGDSLSAGFSMSSLSFYSYLAAMRTQRRGSWVLPKKLIADLATSNECCLASSVGRWIDRAVQNTERLELQIRNYARSGAMVAGQQNPRKKTRTKFLFNIADMSDQVSRLIRKRRFPNMILLWIGHNNLNWSVNDTDVDSIPMRLATDYRDQLVRLVKHSVAGPNHKTEIVVFGLMDFANVFAARNQAQKRRLKEPGLFPGAERSERFWPSLRPAHQIKAIRLADETNSMLKIVVADTARAFALEMKNRKLGLRYSDAMYRTDLADSAYLHPVDALHLSPAGHEKLASSAYLDIEPHLPSLLRR